MDNWREMPQTRGNLGLFQKLLIGPTERCLRNKVVYVMSIDKS